MVRTSLQSSASACVISNQRRKTTKTHRYPCLFLSKDVPNSDLSRLFVQCTFVVCSRALRLVSLRATSTLRCEVGGIWERRCSQSLARCGVRCTQSGDKHRTTMDGWHSSPFMEIAPKKLCWLGFRVYSLMGKGSTCSYRATIYPNITATSGAVSWGAQS